MTFARGVRFIRFMSASVRGRLSGSLKAATCFSASVIASRRVQSCLAAAVFLAVFFIVFAPLVRLCFTCGDNTHFIASQRVGDNEQAALHNAEEDEPLLAVIFADVDKVDGKRIIEGIARLLEADAVLGEIGSSLCTIPFEVIRFHDIYGSPVVGQAAKT